QRPLRAHLGAGRAVLALQRRLARADPLDPGQPVQLPRRPGRALPGGRHPARPRPVQPLVHPRRALPPAGLAVRRLAALAAVVAIGASALLASGFGGSSGSAYRVDALFDDASNLIPGQDVKIAGANVGSVVGVRLTRTWRA